MYQRFFETPLPLQADQVMLFFLFYNQGFQPVSDYIMPMSQDQLDGIAGVAYSPLGSHTFAKNYLFENLATAEEKGNHYRLAWVVAKEIDSILFCFAVIGRIYQAILIVFE